ncbi:DUF2062 domain-containing protein [Paenibacillus sp.]|uniref:DUF2062 domain-containing protein n=1 Tax=Paenibacillus sp. TaxID=58172 RepID=UPI002D707F22|nr:DUF2062 domain-containing protein [Paenibacillus sp.]HZG84835.1 DUF2062 domain-containing protein [Paenibacillus sp.]
MKVGRRIRYSAIRLFRINTGAHKVALGLVTGFFPCWFPTFGIGPLLSVTLTKFMRGYTVAAVISAALGSFLWPVLFYFNYATGRILRSSFHRADPPMTVEEVEYTETATLLQKLGNLGVEFLVGSAVNSILSTIIGYFLFRYLFKKIRPTVMKWLKHSNGRKKLGMN